MVRVLLVFAMALPALAKPVRAVEPNAEQIEFFEKTVRPILVDRCYKCHSSTAKKVKGNLLLDTKGGTLKGGDTGPAIVPGDPQKSLMIKAVHWTDPDLQMPPKQKLDGAQIADLETWVRMGAPDPRADKAVVSPIEQRLIDAKHHWSFQLVKQPRIPDCQGQKPANPIDAFILEKLLIKGMTFSPPADKHTLLRRVYYDLIGLPPTPAEMAAFVADASPSALAKVVDTLLASPRYGERWGRHWLDIARYADNSGATFNHGAKEIYPYAFTYRDYVIDAFNTDKPYDQFITEQLAADLLPQTPGDNRKLAALGFLTVGRRHDDNVDDDVYDDRIDVISRGLLGLTAGCARCHDHKLEPIPTTDYYGLYGILRSSKEPSLYPEMSPQPDSPERRAYREASEKARQAFIDANAKNAEKGLITIRSHVGDYLLAARDGNLKSTYDDHRIEGDILLKRKLHETPYNSIVGRWNDWVLAKQNSAIFTPWLEFAKVPAGDFAARAKELADKFHANGGGALNPLVARMFAGDAPAQIEDVAARYNKLFAQVDAHWRDVAKEAIAKGQELTPGDLQLGGKELRLEAIRRMLAPESDIKLPDADEEEIRQAMIAETAPTFDKTAQFEASRLFPPEAKAELEKVAKDLAAVETLPGAPVRLMAVMEDKPYEARVFIRGNPKQLGAPAPRQFFAVLSGPDRKPFPKNSSGRLELARAIANPENPLTARVIVNRVWQWHFGEGIVRTPSDFGFRGQPPTHPELLDYLAARFVAEGWSLKKLHRSIILSQTYQQRSQPRDDLVKVDPDNDLWGRMNPQPLEFEPFRDSMLALAGTLDLTEEGKPFDLSKGDVNRRTVYAFVDRKTIPNLFRSFDFPDPNFTVAQRLHTALATRALYLLNSAFVVECAKSMAARVHAKAESDRAAAIAELYQLAYQRDPSEHEITRALDYIDRFPEHDVVMPEVAAWQYGFGDYDPAEKRVRNFTPLKFSGKVVKGEKVGDMDLSGMEITPEGGTPAKDKAVIRRWASPLDGKADVYAELVHSSAKASGVTCRIVSSRTGLLGEWTAANSSRLTTLTGIELTRGDTLDFVTVCSDDPKDNSFRWAPTITMCNADIPGMQGMAMRWDAKSDFLNPEKVPQPLGAWEEFAQALLLSNEFAYAE